MVWRLRFEHVFNDGPVLIPPHTQRPVTVGRYLGTKPLRAEVSTRKGERDSKQTEIILFLLRRDFYGS